MSYSRFSKNSDTYTFVGKEIMCCGCLMADKKNVFFETLEDLLIHLLKHRKQNHKVPKQTLRDIIKDL